MGEGARLDDVRQSDEILRRVEAVVAGLLATGAGAPDIRGVADALGTSVRTLQRRLRSEGVSYADVVQRTRCAEARALLRSRSRIGDVARQLGYSDPAHFTRAFQRWMGLTPREYRRRA
jgi:AraC-like DNA-binding protein